MAFRARGCFHLTTALAAALCAAVPASAKTNDAVVLPAVTPVADCTACPALHRPDPDAERQLAALAHELDGVVVDAAQDLGLTIDVSMRPEHSSEPPSEALLVSRAQNNWVISPRIALEGSHVLLRIVAVAPGSSVLLVRTEEIKQSELEVRGVLMMRDLIRATNTEPASPTSAPQADDLAVVHEARSPGRAVLALNAAAFGGYVGFALQRAGGSSDPRLTYPLIALGTGIGLGASMIVADEWDIGVGDAWLLSAGTWWPTVGALLIASNEPASKRFFYGAGAGAAGLVLATTALTFGHMSESDALIAHSGGAFGTFLGGVADLAVQGRTDVSPAPTRGMGVGAISGVVLAGALAHFAPAQAPSRVLLVDLGAGLGAFSGAAVASPLIFGPKVSATRDRLWLSTIAVGTLAGAAVGLLLTDVPSMMNATADSSPTVSPFFGTIAQATKPDGSQVPVTGAGVSGLW